MVVNKDGIAPQTELVPDKVAAGLDLAQAGHIDGAVTCFAYESAAEYRVGQTSFYRPLDPPQTGLNVITFLC